MYKLGTELANAWMKKTLVDLNGFSENEIPKNRNEAYKALNLFYEELDKKTVGWKIGAVAKEVQKEEGFDGPVPGKIFEETILPSNCSWQSGSVTSKRIPIYPINFRFLVGDIKTDLAHTIYVWKFTSPIVVLLTE